MAKSRFRGSVLGMKRPLRRAVLGLMLGAAAAGGTLAVMASAATVEPQLPDLRSDAPDNQSPPEVYSNVPAGVDRTGSSCASTDTSRTSATGRWTSSGTPRYPGAWSSARARAPTGRRWEARWT